MQMVATVIAKSFRAFARLVKEAELRGVKVELEGFRTGNAVLRLEGNEEAVKAVINEMRATYDDAHFAVQDEATTTPPPAQVEQPPTEEQPAAEEQAVEEQAPEQPQDVVGDSAPETQDVVDDVKIVSARSKKARRTS